MDTVDAGETYEGHPGLSLAALPDLSLNTETGPSHPFSYVMKAL